MHINGKTDFLSCFFFKSMFVCWDAFVWRYKDNCFSVASYLF